MTKQAGFKRRVRARMAKTGESYATARVQLTDAGAWVLAGDGDQIALNGIDRWIGGVHLQGHHVPWRWDDGTETIIGVPGKAGSARLAGQG